MELTQARVRNIFDYDESSGLFYYKRSGKQAGFKRDSGYIFLSINGKHHRAHRVAWLYVVGRWPIGEIDHINGVRDDNRVVNLREADRQTNAKNIGKTRINSSGVTGVSWVSRKSLWRAYITHNYKQIHLGYFSCKLAATIVRKSAEKTLGYHENHGR